MQTDPVKVTVRTPKGDTGERLVEFYDKKSGQRGILSFQPPAKVTGNLVVKLLQADDKVEFNLSAISAVVTKVGEPVPAFEPPKAKKAKTAA